MVPSFTFISALACFLRSEVSAQASRSYYPLDSYLALEQPSTLAESDYPWVSLPYLMDYDVPMRSYTPSGMDSINTQNLARYAEEQQEDYMEVYYQTMIEEKQAHLATLKSLKNQYEQVYLWVYMILTVTFIAAGTLFVDGIKNQKRSKIVMKGSGISMQKQRASKEPSYLIHL